MIRLEEKRKIKIVMKESQVEEIKMLIEQAGQGNYFPLLIIAGVIVFCFGIIVILLTNMYKKDQRLTEQRLNDLSTLSAKLSETVIQNSKILAVHETELNQLKKEVA